MWFNLLKFAALAALPCLAHGAPFAYVPNEGSGTLSIIDIASDQVVGDIAAGKKPRGIVISQDGRTAYVSDQTGNQLVLIDLVGRKPAVRSSSVSHLKGSVSRRMAAGSLRRSRNRTTSPSWTRPRTGRRSW
jgi:YVTN family beta-propeller protein